MTENDKTRKNRSTSEYKKERNMNQYTIAKYFYDLKPRFQEKEKISSN